MNSEKTLMSIAFPSLVWSAIVALSLPGAPPAESGPLPSDVMVAFHAGVPLNTRLSVLRSYGLSADAGPNASPAFARLRPPSGSWAARLGTSRLIRALRREPSVRVAEPDAIIHQTSVPNDPSFYAQWSLENSGQTGGAPGADVSAVSAWDTADGEGVIVAVIDSGVDYTHPDLAPNMHRDGSGAVIGWDFYNNDADASDDEYHGTWCAGVIAAASNDGVGIAGVAPRARIMPLKFINPDGLGSTSNAIKCIDWAIQRGARVLNCSWGSTINSQLLLEAIQRAQAAGALVITGAGNYARNNDSTPFYPASYNSVVGNVLAVASTDATDQLSAFSDWGAVSVDVAAPGEVILGPVPGGGYAYLSGTSSSAPIAAGVAALVAGEAPGLTPAQLRDRLRTTSEVLPSLTGKVAAGRIDATAAVNVVTPVQPPAAPTSLSATADIMRVDLAWSASTGADSYTVLRSTTSGSGFAPIASGLSTTSYADQAVAGGTTYYYAICACNVGGNSSPSTQVAACPIAVGTTTKRIEAGGTAYTASDGSVFAADSSYSGGKVLKLSSTWAGTSDPTLFSKVRAANSFSYSLSAANGAYKLRLHFGEGTYSTAGSRKFNVVANGVTLLSGFDVCAAAGGKYKAITLEFPLTVSNGTLVLGFTRTVGEAMVSAIELVPATP